MFGGVDGVLRGIYTCVVCTHNIGIVGLSLSLTREYHWSLALCRCGPGTPTPPDWEHSQSGPAGETVRIGREGGQRVTVCLSQLCPTMNQPASHPSTQARMYKYHHWRGERRRRVNSENCVTT